jgi:hypothetical protein
METEEKQWTEINTYSLKKYPTTPQSCETSYKVHVSERNGKFRAVIKRFVVTDQQTEISSSLVLVNNFIIYTPYLQ